MTPPVFAAAVLLAGFAAAMPASAQDPIAERDRVRAALAEELGLTFVETIPAEADIGLLAVDVQRSFTDPGEALYVAGAETDVAAVNTFVRRHVGRIPHAWYTMDTHPRYYVGSKLYLVDANGAPAPMFQDIAPDAILSGVYKPANPNHQDHAEAYARCLAEKSLSWNVWPDHGVEGSHGWSLHPVIETLFDDYTAHWAPRTQRAPDPMIVYKGSNPHTEAFGGVSALCPNADPQTQTQELWVDELHAHVARGGVILAFGEAINFCLSGTLIPLVEEAGLPAESIILAYDAASPIPVFAERTREVLGKARNLGIRFTLLENLSVDGEWREASLGQPELNYALPRPQ